jgi:hypothetical protein
LVELEEQYRYAEPNEQEEMNAEFIGIRGVMIHNL